ncbi:MAG: hypothetical protein CSA66_02520 [Proteobacteria bacterium]|nr:MAG: hypothetical protein CSA66_02520 [Pseudomonadota bacterium]
MTLALATSIALALGATPPQPGPASAAAVILGVDVLLSDEIALVEGKRVGLVTNQSGVDGRLVPTADRLAADPRVNLVQLYAPEHGLRGAERAGRKLADARDPVTGVPIESLFGAGRRRPSAKSLAGVDVLLFDIQDVGSRTYTYVTTLGEAMTAAAQAGVPFVVLDRPNPQGGLRFEGPIREPGRKSFIGWGPLPVTHGMTFGEVARLYNAALDLGCDLRVVRMKGWRRAMTWEDTGLRWVPTSPGIPHVDNARLYVATGMFAGVSTNVNEGVGTTLPFETLAAEWIDAQALHQLLTAADLPGVIFRPTTYKPRYHRFRGKTLHGVQLLLTDPAAFLPLRTALTLMTAVERLYPGRARFRSDRYVGRVWGTDAVLPRVRAGASVADIEALWAHDLKAFGDERARHLLYR